jgi:hypothetical protein
VTLSIDGVVLRGAGNRPVRPWMLDLAPGTHTVRLASAEAAVELTKIVCGVERPKRGRVLAFGREPYETPELRARIGSQFDRDFAGVSHLTVEALWASVRALRKRHGGVSAEPLGLLEAARLEVPVRTLALTERRDFELELALDSENAQVIWLCQPPRPRGQAAQEAVLARLRRRAADGAVVVVTASSEREAAFWGDEQHAAEERSAAEGYTILLVVERPREIAAALQLEAVVLATELDAERPNVLLVHGSDDLALRRACGTAVVARRCELFEMVSLPRQASAAAWSALAGERA